MANDSLARAAERWGIWAVLLAGLLVRLWLASIDGHLSDLRQYERWSYDLAHGSPPWDFYHDSFKDYLPGYVYVLWWIGLLAKWFSFSEETWFYFLKLPSIAADLASAYLLYLFLSERPYSTRLWAAGTYLFLPTVLLIGPLWGQVDSLLALALLGVAYLLGKDRPVAAAAVYTVGFMTKPIAIAAFPFLAVWGARNYRPRVWLECSGVAFAVGLGMTLPFFPADPWNIFELAYDTTQVFGHSSSFAYNFFGAFGWFRDDNLETWYIDWWKWALFLTVLAEAAVVYSLRNARGPGMLALGIGLSMLVFFTFQTRMHERYMFGAFLPLLAACFYLNRPLLWASFAPLSLIQYFALYQAFFHPFFNPGVPEWLYMDWLTRMLNWSPGWWHRPGSFTQFLCSAFVVLDALALMAYAFLLQHRVRVDPVRSEGEQTLGRRTALG